ncbi:MAG: hypothetical protein FWC26_05010, partial [Fibromonadales bacterium]|nr:hypothetical protein [Fibromonadales bacterium]
GTGSYAGGLVGQMDGSIITGSYASGDVSGTFYTGGLMVGRMDGGTITGSYASGDVSGYYAGGLVGSMSGGSSITGSYYNSETSGKNDTRGIPKTTAEMKTQSTYVGWDFTSTWTIDPSLHGGYPVLQYLLEERHKNFIAYPQIYIANQRLKGGSLPSTIMLHTGSPITPAVVSVFLNGKKLEEGTDYEITYSNNKDISTIENPAKITVKGIGGYHGKKTFKFYITNFRDLSANTVNVDSIPDQLATGSAINYKPTVKDYGNCYDDLWLYQWICLGGVTLVENLDYILGYSDNKNAGKATIEIIGIEIYDGTSKAVNFNIVGQKSLTSANTTVKIIDSTGYVYSGSKITPEVTVTHSTDGLLAKDKDYTIGYGNNTNAGNGTITINGIGNYTGSVPKTFPIARKPLSTSMASPVEAQKFTGDQIKPEVELKDGETTLKPGTDYSVSYLSNTDPGQAMIRISGTGNYSATTITIFFTIYEDDSEPDKIDLTVSWKGPFTFEYNGQARCPDAIATDGDGKPFNVTPVCVNAVNARPEAYEATATYSDYKYNLLNKTAEFHITQAPTTATLYIPNISESQNLTKNVSGTKENPAVSYWYSSQRQDAYTQTEPKTEGVYYAYAAVSPTSNYLGAFTDTTSFSIYKGSPAEITITWSAPYEFTYNGEPQGPGASVSQGGYSLPLHVSKETNAGTYKAVAKFQPERTDYKIKNPEMQFTIKPKPLAGDAIEPIGNYPFEGTSIKPSYIVVKDGSKTLSKDIDYTISYGENISGTGTVTANGIGNYAGTASRSFIITSETATSVAVYWSKDTVFTYNGKEQCPAATADGGYQLEVFGCHTDADKGYTAVAQLKNANSNLILTNASRPYTILPKPLQVTWTKEREFTYNKMVQVPIPSVEEKSVELRVVNGHSAAGVYEGVLAPFAQIVSSNAGNYELQDHTIDRYEIIKRDLNPYFTSIYPDDFPPSADTLWVSHEVFADSTLLREALEGIIDYEGFQTDTTKEVPETDNAAVLKGKPKVSVKYDDQDGNSQGSKSFLAKRVETTQKATATIITDDVSADNYKPLTRPTAIVILATVVEDDNAPQIFCKRNSKYAEMGRNTCGAIGGEIFEELFCIMDSDCTKITASFSLTACTSLDGEVVQTCNETPIAQTPNPIPYTPATPHYYSLKGTFLGTQKPTAPGIYIEANVETQCIASLQCVSTKF